MGVMKYWSINDADNKSKIIGIRLGWSMKEKKKVVKPLYRKKNEEKK